LLTKGSKLGVTHYVIFTFFEKPITSSRFGDHKIYFFRGSAGFSLKPSVTDLVKLYLPTRLQADYLQTWWVILQPLPHYGILTSLAPAFFFLI